MLGNRDFCGERGIRTPGGVTLAGFQDQCIRPLCHFSQAATKIESFFQSLQAFTVFILFTKLLLMSFFAPIFAGMDAWYHYVLLVGVGFAVGFVNTIAGGGSLLSLPVLIFLGLPPSVANGTNRVAIVIQTALATAGFKSKGVSTYPFNAYLGFSALIGALIGAYIAVDIKGETFNKILAIVMVVVVLIIIFSPKINTKQIQERITGKYLWLGILVFFFFGIYGGFINAGLGFAMILFLHYVNHMTLVRANATKVAVVFIYTLAALAVFVLNDKVNWKVGLILAIGNGTGAWLASRISVQRGDGFIKTFLIIMVIAMAIKLWFFNS